MADFAQMALRIVADADDAVRDLRRVNNEVEDLNRKTQESAKGTQTLAGGLVQAGLAATGLIYAAKEIGTALGGMLSSAIEAAAAFQQLDMQLRFAAGSESAAENLRALVDDLSLLPAVTREFAASGISRLVALGVAAEDAANLIKGVALAAAASGGGAEEAAGGITAFAQALGKQKLQAEELQQIAERNLVPILTVLDEKYGVTTGSAEEFNKRLEAAGLTLKDLIPAIGVDLVNATSALAEQGFGTLGNQANNLNQQINQIKALVGQPFLTPLAEALSGINAILEKGLSWWDRNREAIGKWLGPLDQLLMGLSKTYRAFREIFTGLRNEGKKAIEEGIAKASEPPVLSPAGKAAADRFAATQAGKDSALEDEAKKVKLLIDLARARGASEAEIVGLVRKQANIEEEIARKKGDVNAALAAQVTLAQQLKKAADERQAAIEKGWREQEKIIKEEEARRKKAATEAEQEAKRAAAEYERAWEEFYRWQQQRMEENRRLQIQAMQDAVKRVDLFIEAAQAQGRSEVELTALEQERIAAAYRLAEAQGDANAGLQAQVSLVSLAAKQQKDAADQAEKARREQEDALRDVAEALRLHAELAKDENAAAEEVLDLNLARLQVEYDINRLQGDRNADLKAEVDFRRAIADYQKEAEQSMYRQQAQGLANQFLTSQAAGGRRAEIAASGIRSNFLARQAEQQLLERDLMIANYIRRKGPGLLERQVEQQLSAHDAWIAEQLERAFVQSQRSGSRYW